MFNFKDWFSVGDREQKVISIEDTMIEIPEGSVNERDVVPVDTMTEVVEKDISSPVYTIVDKIKENPKRLEFSKVSDYRCSVVTDTLTGGLVQYTPEADFCNYYGFKWVAELYSKNITFTQDEIEYILSELLPIYDLRKKRLQDIKTIRKERQELRNREVIQKQWEDS